MKTLIPLTALLIAANASAWQPTYTLPSAGQYIQPDTYQPYQYEPPYQSAQPTYTQPTYKPFDLGTRNNQVHCTSFEMNGIIQIDCQ